MSYYQAHAVLMVLHGSWNNAIRIKPQKYFILQVFIQKLSELLFRVIMTEERNQLVYHNPLFLLLQLLHIDVLTYWNLLLSGKHHPPACLTSSSVIHSVHCILMQLARINICIMGCCRLCACMVTKLVQPDNVEPSNTF